LNEPSMTIPMELAEALLEQLAAQFYGDNDGESPGNLISRIKRLTCELHRVRSDFDKLLTTFNNFSVVESQKNDGPSY
jgi:hypothetical protein